MYSLSETFLNCLFYFWFISCEYYLFIQSKRHNLKTVNKSISSAAVCAMILYLYNKNLLFSSAFARKKTTNLVKRKFSRKTYFSWTKQNWQKEKLTFRHLFKPKISSTSECVIVNYVSKMWSVEYASIYAQIYVLKLWSYKMRFMLSCVFVCVESIYVNILYTWKFIIIHAWCLWVMENVYHLSHHTQIHNNNRYIYFFIIKFMV